MWLLTGSYAVDQRARVLLLPRRRSWGVRSVGRVAALALLAALLGVVVPAPLSAQTLLTDYDTDDDGLIEIANLAQLNALRWDLDGDGTVAAADQSSYAAAFPNAALTMGCASTSVTPACTGYELNADLDFDSDNDGDVDAADHGGAYWNNGAGWSPIGGEYTAILEGNGRTIANLFIHAPATAPQKEIGLFARVGAGGEVRHLGLPDASVTANGAKVSVGTLAGHSRGTLRAVYSSGSVQVDNPASPSGNTVYAGGLVGYQTTPDAATTALTVDSYSTASVTAHVSQGSVSAGGLMGVLRKADVKRSYATGTVTESNCQFCRVGGLVGDVYLNAKVGQSYAAGSISVTQSSHGHVGGLVGLLTVSDIDESFAIGEVSVWPTGDVGGLLGLKADNTSVVSADSYWDSTSTGQSTSDGGTAKTTSELQADTNATVAGTGYTGIYRTWTTADWDFGTSCVYPALVADFNNDGTATWAEFGQQRADTHVRKNRDIGGQEVSLGSTTSVALEGSNPVFGYCTGDKPTYTATSSDTSVATVSVNSSTDTLTVTGVAKGTATIRVTATDSHGNATSVEFPVASGHRFPTVANAVATLNLPRYGQGSIPLETAGSAVFSDPEGTALTYSVTTMHESYHSASVDAATATVKVVAHASGDRPLVITATDADGAGVSTTVTVSVSSNADYDGDNDGLLEIHNLAQLNAVRWDLDGNGTADQSGDAASYRAAFVSPISAMGCPSDGCDGYELVADLDFDGDGDGDVDAADHGGAYWNSGKGWDPIGDDTDSFDVTFRGNGHTVANLYIDEPEGGDDSFGLFEHIAVGGSVSGLVLADVDIAVVGTKPDVGALAGTARASINRVGVTGTVSGIGNQGTTGGIVGSLRGLSVTLVDSYSAAAVTGGNDVGGLVGRATSVTVTRGYATGPVSNTNTGTGGHRVGGLVGYANGATVEYGYATSSVDAPSNSSTDVGGLVGLMDGGRVREGFAAGAIKYGTDQSFAGDLGGLVGAVTGGASVDSDAYWDSVATTASSSAGGGTAKTTSQLQADTDTVVRGSAYTGIYSTWGDSSWHFGNEIEYPALVADFDGDGTSTWGEFGFQRDASAPSVVTPIADQTIGVTGKYVVGVEPAGAAVFDVGVQGALTYTVSSSDSTVATAVLDSTGKVVTVTGVAAGTADVSVVATDFYGDTGTDTFRVTVVTLLDYDVDDDGLIEVGSLAQLNALRWDLDGDGTVSDADYPAYAAAFPTAASHMGCNDDETATEDQVCVGYELTADLDFDSDGDGDVDAADHGGAWWNSGKGWAPIGPRYRAVFDGGGHTIANLFISESAGGDASYGLFAQTSGSARLRNVVLADVSISVTGNKADVGALVGTSRSPISRVGVTGSVVGNAPSGTTGGVAGTFKDAQVEMSESYSHASVTGTNDVGGLIGRALNAKVTRSYTEPTVTVNAPSGTAHLGGGLIGLAENTTVEFAYASGSVTGPGGSGSSVGGLIGRMSGGTVHEGYAAGPVSAAASVGGLVGTAEDSAVVDTDAYWDATTTGAATSAGGGTSQTTSGLQSDSESAVGGASYTGIYSTWSDPDWHFGNAKEYPVLVVDFNGDGNASWLEFGSPRRNDYDMDDDGLIEIVTPAQLNAMRWDPTGKAKPGAANSAKYYDAFVGGQYDAMGCPDAGCSGYELVANVDLDTNGNGFADSGDLFWNGGDGWDPIHHFQARVEGNGHAVLNLYIDRDEDFVGLFGELGYHATVNRLHLENVDITGGDYNVGALVGLSYAEVSHSSSSGQVSGGGWVGGLIGETTAKVSSSYSTADVTSTGRVAGGLIGYTNDTVTHSFATGHVAGARRVGGLVGQNNGGLIADSYAAGRVTGQNRVGGLVGVNNSYGISHSYSRATVIGNKNTGGLVGIANSSSDAIYSYWDETVTGLTTSAGGQAKTTAELTAPTGRSGIYAHWGHAWDFGTDTEYPALKADTNGDGTATVEEFGEQRPGT